MTVVRKSCEMGGRVARWMEGLYVGLHEEVEGGGEEGGVESEYLSIDER